MLFLVFTAWPVISSLFMSVTDIKSRDLQNPFAVNFVGFENFASVLSDPIFQKAALNTLYFVVVGVPLTILVALAIALALNTGITKLSGFFRVGYYMPVVTTIVAVAVVWRFLLQPENGLINEVLGWFGIQGPDWLGSTTWAMPSLIAMSVWRSLGTLVVIFLAGLQSRAQGPARGRRARRRQRVAAAAQHHPADPAPDHAVRRRDHRASGSCSSSRSRSS